MSERPIRVCLIMHSTRSDNLGVGALTVSEVEILRCISRDIGRPIDITVFDWKDQRVPYVTGPDIRIIDMDRKEMASPFGYFTRVRKADLVIDVGAGDSFTDIYGGKRLTRMFMLKYLTHLAGTPLVMAPQTIGPFTKPLSRMLARISMQRSALVATRDRMSTEAARDLLGSRREILEASDLALRLPFDPPPPRALGGPVRVGINISALLMNGGYTGRNQFGLTLDYPRLICDLIRYFKAHPDGCEVHLVPHVVSNAPAFSHMEDDISANHALVEEFPGLVEAPRFPSPSAAKNYIAGLDFFMGARMHACIAAFSTGVPVVPMAYSRKFAGLFGSLGYTQTVDCTQQGNEEIFAAIVAAYARRVELSAEMQIAFAKGLEKVGHYEAHLRQLAAKCET